MRGRTGLLGVAVAVVLLTGFGVETVSTPYARQLGDVKTCLQRDGYAVHSLTIRTLAISWLPAQINRLPVPFFSKRVPLPLLFVDWAKPQGVQHPSIDIRFFSTTANAAIGARRRMRAGTQVHRIANVVFDREPGDYDVAAAIAECVKPPSSKHLRRVPIAIDVHGSLSHELRRVLVRTAPPRATRIGCSERRIAGRLVLCAVTFLDGTCEVWQVSRSKRGRIDTAPMTPWECTVVFGSRPKSWNR